MKKQSNTCILVTIYNNKTYMASDRRVTVGSNFVSLTSNPKSIHKNGVMIAATGECSLFELVANRLELPRIKNKDDTYDYVFNYIKEGIVRLLLESGYKTATGSLSIPSSSATEFLVIVRNRLFTIDLYPSESTLEDGLKGLVTLTEMSMPYAAGCGSEYAIGAFKALEYYRDPTGAGTFLKQHLKESLRVAALFSPGCDSNIDIIESD